MIKSPSHNRHVKRAPRAKTKLVTTVVIRIYVSSVNHEQFIPVVEGSLVADAHGDAQVAERVSLVRSAPGSWLLRGCGSSGIAVSLDAAFGSTAACKSRAATDAAHGPARADALAEVIGARDAVDERHVVPDVAVNKAIFELHGLVASVAVELEGRVTIRAGGQRIDPAGTSGDGATLGVAAWVYKVIGDIVAAVVVKRDTASASRGSTGGLGGL